jgi:hypothetical protein
MDVSVFRVAPPLTGRAQLFAVARKEHPEFVRKIIAIGADLEKENMGMDEKDTAMLIEQCVPCLVLVELLRKASV